MSRASIALIAATAALLVSVAANVVAFTRTETKIRPGSVGLTDLAPNTRAQLRGEKGEPGEPGKRGARGRRGARGPVGPPGVPGTDAPDVSDQVESLEGIISNICGWYLAMHKQIGET